VGVSLSLTFLRCFKEMQGGNDVSEDNVLCRRESRKKHEFAL